MKYVNMNLEMKSIHVTFAGFLQVKKKLPWGYVYKKEH